MGGSNMFSGWLTKGALTLAAGAFIASVAMPANAATLRKSSAGAATSAATGGTDPGSALYGYFDVHEPPSLNGTGDGQNAMELINTTSQDMCALIYVFDDDEQLGECCGCPLTANELVSFGIGFRGPLYNNLTGNWREASYDTGNGVVLVVGATALAGCTFNGSSSNNSTYNPACNAGCDPTIHFQGGVLVQSTPSGQGLNGGIIRPQRIGAVENITETTMFDDSPGDPTNISALQDFCQNAVQRGSGRGWCTCPNTFPTLSSD